MIPLTSNTARVFAGEALVSVNDKDHKAIASQLTTASKIRIGDRIGALSPEDLWKVENAILFQTGITE